MNRVEADELIARLAQDREELTGRLVAVHSEMVLLRDALEQAVYALARLEDGLPCFGAADILDDARAALAVKA